MTLRLHWETAEASGGVPLRARVQHLAWTGEALDPVSRLGPEQPGLVVHPPDAAGRVLLEGQDGLVLGAGGRTVRRARLRPGAGLSFRADGVTGRIRVEGEAPGDDPLLGATLGGYRIRVLLGRGAVGSVYRALQEALDRDVALKVLDPELARDPMKVASFRREAVAAGRLVHPHLVQVYDVGEDRGHHFYSMELVPGGSLEDRLRTEGPLPWQEAVAAIRDCARALAYAEEHHLVHRDVKPANLMVDASGHVKLADLGLAATRGLVAREAAGGTPHFMAPENLTGGPVDHRADLYSLGCSLYRLITGRTPFEGETVRDILRAHRDAPPPTFRQAGVRVPRPLEELLAALLAKDPEDRPAHARDVVEACERCLQIRRRRRRLVPVLGVLILGAAFAAWRLRARAPAVPPPNPVAARSAAAERARLEARLQEERLGRIFAEALAIHDPARRIPALEAFLADHPDAPQADAARRALQAAREAVAAAAAGGDQGPGVDPEEEEAARLHDEVAALLAAGRPGAALAAVDAAALDPGRLAPERDAIFAAARERLAAAREAHARALAAGDLDGAAGIRRELAGALSGPADLPPPWQETLQELADAEGAAARARAVAAFADQRRTLAARLAGAVLPALLAGDPVRALETWREAAAGVSHPGLARALADQESFLQAAAAAGTAFRAALAAAADGLDIHEPEEGKRARLLEVLPGGLAVEVLVRGERVRRIVPWDSVLRPDFFPDLLREVLGEQADPRAATAWLLATAEARAAARLRAWGTTPPDPTAAQGLADEIRAWLAALPAAWDSPPPWLASHRQALAAAGRVAEALGAGEDYPAWQSLRELLGRFGLLAALASDGRSDWGMEP